MKHLWGFEGHCSVAWLAVWLHKVLLLSVRVEIVGTENLITLKNSGLTRIAYSTTEKCSKCSINEPRKRLLISVAHKNWTRKKFRHGNGSK